MKGAEINNTQSASSKDHLPLSSPSTKANHFFHALLLRETEAAEQSLGDQIPYISVFDGELLFEINGNKITHSIHPPGYTELKSLCHLLCAVPFCYEFQDKEQSQIFLHAEFIDTSISFLPDHIRKEAQELVTYLRENVHLINDIQDISKWVGKITLRISHHIGSEQIKLLEKLWANHLAPAIGECMPQTLVTIGGSRSAEANEIVTTFFQRKLSEIPGNGASNERHVIFCHSPKSREAMKTVAAQRMVSRELGKRLFNDEFAMQSDILSRSKKTDALLS